MTHGTGLLFSVCFILDKDTNYSNVRSPLYLCNFLLSFGFIFTIYLRDSFCPYRSSPWIRDPFLSTFSYHYPLLPKDLFHSIKLYSTETGHPHLTLTPLCPTQPVKLGNQEFHYPDHRFLTSEMSSDVLINSKLQKKKKINRGFLLLF